jgi:undecaprenyl-diphosphatase
MPRRTPVVSIGVTLGLFGVLAAAVRLAGMPSFAWDRSAAQTVQALPWPAEVTPFMRGVSFAGDDVILAAVLVGGSALILLAFDARREAAVLLVAVAAEQAVKIAVKHLVARPRPTVRVLIAAKEVYSFPSGHTVHYVVFLGFLWYLVYRDVKSRWVRWPLLAVLGGLVVLIGFSRVYLGAHWPSDVLGGYLLGAAVLTAAIGLYERWVRRARAAAALLGKTAPD